MCHVLRYSTNTIYLIYSPSGLDVKVEGEELIVTASQSVEDKSRVYQQRFGLPAGIRPQQVQSSLTRDGVLVITAEREEEGEEEKMNKALSHSSWMGRDSGTYFLLHG